MSIPRPPLFQGGVFVLHAGQFSEFKIDCDAITSDEMIVLAAQMAKRIPPFRFGVHGIPRGGIAFAASMERYGHTSGPLLICDDVFSTGTSIMEAVNQAYRKSLIAEDDWIAAVLFARGPTPPNVYALFSMAPELE